MVGATSTAATARTLVVHLAATSGVRLASVVVVCLASDACRLAVARLGAAARSGRGRLARRRTVALLAVETLGQRVLGALHGTAVHGRDVDRLGTLAS